jgi:hypothetical protein
MTPRQLFGREKRAKLAIFIVSEVSGSVSQKLPGRFLFVLGDKAGPGTGADGRKVRT